MINVVVGTNGNTYPVHESLICASSNFFQTARKPEWSAGNPGVVDLSDEMPDIFEVYLHWLYFKTFPTIQDQDPEYMELGQCYVLGEKLLDVKFKNAVIDAMSDVLENQPEDDVFIPGPLTIETVYEGTPKGSPARALLVDMWAVKAGKFGKADLDECPPEFAIDLAKEFLELNLLVDSPWEYSMEKYHEK
jgi:hypothetical protein